MALRCGDGGFRSRHEGQFQVVARELARLFVDSAAENNDISVELDDSRSRRSRGTDPNRQSEFCRKDQHLGVACHVKRSSVAAGRFCLF